MACILVPVWRSRHGVGRIDEVTLRRSQLVLNWYVTSHSGQLSLLPSAGSEMSTGQSAVILSGSSVKAGVAYSVRG